MLATFAFDVCHDVYRAAREAIDSKIPTLNAEAAGKYQWRPDRLPRLAEYVCDFALAGERALGEEAGCAGGERREADAGPDLRHDLRPGLHPTLRPGLRGGRASRMAMFRVYYLGGADYHAARRQMGISELTWADWAEEIRRRVGWELTRAGMFPPAKYFRETAARAS